MIALADCNNFYASCERVFNPALKNKPILVLSNNDGCIIARSNEAKKLGFQMGEPVFKKQQHIKKNNVSVFSTNFELYGDMSNRIMSILAEESPEIEIYSIDESFIDLEGIRKKEEFAKQIKEKVWKWTGIPISIGIGPTKTLAKIANAKAKKNGKGICILNSKKKIETLLKKTNISDIWGIGKKTRDKLNCYGVYTGYDFIKIKKKQLKTIMSTNIIKTQEELKGEQKYSIKTSPEKKKSICTSRSFLKEIEDYEELKKKVIKYSMRCAEKLRKQKRSAQTITVFIQTNRFKKNKYSNVKSIILNIATNDSIEIIQHAKRLLKSIYKSNKKYKKAGIVLGNIIEEKHIQMNFFDKIDRKKRKKLMIAVDKINYLNGRETISIGIKEEKKRIIKQKKRSPSYTTKWEDLITAN